MLELVFSCAAECSFARCSQCIRANSSSKSMKYTKVYTSFYVCAVYAEKFLFLWWKWSFALCELCLSAPVPNDREIMNEISSLLTWRNTAQMTKRRPSDDRYTTSHTIFIMIFMFVIHQLIMLLFFRFFSPIVYIGCYILYVRR